MSTLDYFVLASLFSYDNNVGVEDKIMKNFKAFRFFFGLMFLVGLLLRGGLFKYEASSLDGATDVGDPCLFCCD